MTKASTLGVTAVIGLDLGDRWAHVGELDAAGQVVREGRVAMTPEAFWKAFCDRPPTRIVLEAGTHSAWVSRLLQRLKHDVIVANPRKLPLIYADTCKSDRRDALALARIARIDPALLAPIKHRGVAAQSHLALIRARDALVRGRTLLINHVRGVLKAFGARLPVRSAASCHRDALERVPMELTLAMEPLLQALAAMSRQIRECERRIERLAKQHYPETALLHAVPGVGLLTALAFVLTLEDPRRFKRSRMVGAYLGLTAREHSSGASKPELGITKAGDRLLRRLLVQCAHYILGPHGPDSDLRRFGLALAAKGPKSAKKRAIIAVARRLAVLLHRLWVSGEVYEPLRLAKRRGELIEQAA